MTITIKNAATINAEGIHTQANRKEVFCKTTGKFYASVSDAAKSVNGSVGSMSCALKHYKGMYKGMKWCYVSDIEAHLDDIASDIRANLEKAIAYDTMMRKKEEIKNEQNKLEQHEARKEELNAEIAKLLEAINQEDAIIAETQNKINALKEEFFK